MSNIIDLHGNAVNSPTMPEPRPLTEAEREQSQLRLQQFADGHIYKWTHHPTQEGLFVLFDVNNVTIAVLDSAPVSDLLCQAVRMLFHAVSVAKALPGTPDNLVAAANTPEMLAGQQGEPKTEAGSKSPNLIESPVMES